MSVVEDTRKVLQDFLAPELRELKGSIAALGARLDALESKTDVRFDALESKKGARFDAMESKLNALESRMEARFNALETKLLGYRDESARVSWS